MAAAWPSYFYRSIKKAMAVEYILYARLRKIV